MKIVVYNPGFSSIFTDFSPNLMFFGDFFRISEFRISSDLTTKLSGVVTTFIFQ